LKFRILKILGLLCVGLLTLGNGPASAEELRLPRIAEAYRIGDNAYVRALKVDEGHNSLWVGTSAGAIEVDLSSLDLKNVYTRAEGLANEYVFAIGIDKEGEIWLGTNAGGVNKTKPGGGWKIYFPMHGLADFWVYSFAYEDNGNVWIGTWDGVSVFDPKTETFKTYRNELVNVWVYGMDIDKMGRIWMGTEGGVSVYDHGKWSSWTHEDGLGADNVSNAPSSPNTGLGTRSRHDLSVFDSGGKDTYNPNYVFASHVDNKTGDIWFGTWGGGVSLFDGEKKWQSLSSDDVLAGNIVYSIAQEKDGTLWFGTNNGASRYDGKNWTTFNRSNGLIGNSVFAITVDPENNIWLGTKGGVSRLTYNSAVNEDK